MNDPFDVLWFTVPLINVDETMSLLRKALK